MPAEKVLSVETRAKDSGTVSMLKSIGDAAVRTAKQLADLKKSSGSGEASVRNDGALKQLKDTFGAKSDLGQLGKILKGGGAVLGLRLIAGEITKASDAARELKKQVDAGNLSGSQIAVGVAKAVPIFGELVNASQSFSDALASLGEQSDDKELRHLLQFDDAAFLLKLPQLLALTKDGDDAITESLAKQRAVLKGIAEDRRKLGYEAVKAGLEGNALKSYELKIAGENRLAEVQKKREAALEDQKARAQAAELKARADGADLDPAAQAKIMAGAFARANAEKKAINDGFDKEAADAAKANDAERLAAAKEHAKKMSEATADMLKEIGDIQFAGRQRNLRAMGDTLNAELEAVKHGAEDKKQEIQKALKEQLAGASADDAVTFKKNAADELNAIDDAAAGDAEEIQRQHAEKMAGLQMESAKELSDIRSEARANQLKAMGDELGAELVMIQKGAQDKKEAIAKALKDRLRGASAGDAAAFTQDAADQTNAVDDDAATQAKLARKTQQLEVVKTLQESQIDVLKHQADAGDEYAAAELKRLEVVKASNDEQRKLLDLLKQQLQPAERAAALADLQALKDADRAAAGKQLRDQQLETLKAAAEYGATGSQQVAAKRQIEALKLKKQYDEAAANAAAIVNNPNASAEDKAAAEANLKSYASTLARQFDKEAGGNEPLKKTADLQERGLLITGVAAAARAKADPQDRIAGSSAEAVKLQKSINDALRQFMDWSKQQAQQAPKIVFGVSE